MEKKSTGNKRGRKRVFKDRKEGNRVRSQRHREHKNNYIAKLENEVRELKRTVTDLSRQVEFYKNLFKTKNIDPDKEAENFKFLREESYGMNEFGNVIDNTPLLVKHITHLQNWDNFGLMSESRIKFIK